jgi:predicted transcriptional regulator
MEAVFRLNSATAVDIAEAIPDPPTNDAVRRTIRILEEKGYLRHEEDGPRHVYYPTVEPEKARRSAINHVINTYFSGSVSQAISSLLESSEDQISPDELERIRNLIEERKREGL